MSVFNSLTMSARLLFRLLICVAAHSAFAANAGLAPPRVVNIINFIRGEEPRRPMDLLTPVREQLALAKTHRLPSTYLLQYDALIKPEFVELLKKEMQPGDEVGVWLEVVQPQVEAAGLTWRGRYPWDWHTHVGFTIGYLPDERRKLMDVLMEKFRENFGQYPQSVGCWLIGAPTLNYLAEKYGIGAATICKDQSGTDGYTLWGGYWNQGFYPAKNNAFMPAQTAAAQVKVPVFRMLGSDPVDQYDTSLGAKKQGVISLEPVYPQSGGNPEWVRWFFDVNFDARSLTWAYAQAGQENSFGWPAMEKGLKDQYQKLAELRDAGRVRVETLGATGEWFRNTFEQTPATAVVALSDSEGRNRGSIWYENAHYRLNFFFEGDTWRIRDIHQFNENYPERYLETRVTTNDAFYDTLPVIDGYNWSSAGGERAGIRLGSINVDGVLAPWKTGKPTVKEIGRDSLLITLPILNGGEIALLCTPAGIKFKVSNTTQPWALEMNWSSEKKTVVERVDVRAIHYRHNHFAYTLALPDARATARQSNRISIQPDADAVTFNFK